MTKLLEQAIEGLRELPDDMQDKAARQLIQYVDEVTDDGGEFDSELQQKTPLETGLS